MWVVKPITFLLSTCRELRSPSALKIDTKNALLQCASPPRTKNLNKHTHYQNFDWTQHRDFHVKFTTRDFNMFNFFVFDFFFLLFTLCEIFFRGKMYNVFNCNNKKTAHFLTCTKTPRILIFLIISYFSTKCSIQDKVLGIAELFLRGRCI